MLFKEPEYLNDAKNGLDIFQIKEYQVLCKRLDIEREFVVRVAAYSEIDAENRVRELISENKLQHQYDVEVSIHNLFDNIVGARDSSSDYKKKKEAVANAIHELNNKTIARIATIDLGLED